MIQWRELIFESNLGAKLDMTHQFNLLHPEGRVEVCYRAHGLHC